MNVRIKHVFSLLLADTAAILRAKEPMWPGIYEVEFLVKDMQGHSCPKPQKVDIRICNCKDATRNAEEPCGEQGTIKKDSELGPAGIGLLLLGLLLILCKYNLMLLSFFSTVWFDYSKGKLSRNVSFVF